MFEKHLKKRTGVCIMSTAIIVIAIVAVLIAVVGGLILMVLGLLGEYIGRMYISINKSPQFVVRSIVKKEDLDADKKQ